MRPLVHRALRRAKRRLFLESCRPISATAVVIERHLGVAIGCRDARMKKRFPRRRVFLPGAPRESITTLQWALRRRRMEG
jgi:hypothetical protein